VAGVGTYAPVETYTVERGAYVIPLTGEPTTVDLRDDIE
jgi:hypothetical protein